jgi:hypothetical protein
MLIKNLYQVYISYEAFYFFLLYRGVRNPPPPPHPTPPHRIEKNAISFSILHILHILLFIIIKFYVYVSFHIILLLCVVQNYSFFILFRV